MSDIWTLDGARARLSHHGARAAVDLLRPDLGLVDVVWQDAELPIVSLLAVDLPEIAASPESLSDRWVRGHDLVAVYEPTAARPTRVEVYWRLVSIGEPGNPAWMVELQVSVQTQLLDSHPEIGCLTRIAAEPPARLQAGGQWRQTATGPATGVSTYVPPTDLGCTLFRLPEHSAAYAEMVYPADFRVDQLSRPQGGPWRLEHRLFPEFLEKGVILRSRMRGLVCPPSDAPQRAARVQHEFSQAPLPLTA